MHGRRHRADLRAISRQHHSSNRLNAIAKKLLEFYPEPNNGTGGLTSNYLSLQDRVIDKNQYTQRMDLVQSNASTWMGRYSYANENEIAPALKLNGTKLETRIHQVAVGNAWTVSPTLVTNSGSATTTSSTRSGASWRSSVTW